MIATRHARPNAVSAQKMERHPPATSSQPRTRGATIGATPMTSIRIEKIRAESCWSYQSRTTARATTTPAQPPSACNRRNAIRHDPARQSAARRGQYIQPDTGQQHRLAAEAIGGRPMDQLAAGQTDEERHQG